MADTKTCPYCGQEIMAVAKKCRWCGEWLTADHPTPSNVTYQQQQAQQEAQHRAEEEARKRAEEEARRRTEEEARRRSEEEAQRRAEEEARKRAAEEEARRRAEEEARLRAEREARLRAKEEEIKRKAEEATQRAQQAMNKAASSLGESLGLNDGGSDKLTVMGVLTEGFAIGLTNFVTIFVALILFVLTCWIPYVNVGTFIALQTMPVELQNEGMRSPTFIFDGRYRKYMGEFFMLMGLMLITLIPAYFFMVVPGIIISIGWSLAYCLLVDKEVNASEALTLSNKLTYGNKLTIFLISLAIGVVLFVILMLLNLILAKTGFFLTIVNLIVFALYFVVKVGCETAIYKKLTANI